MKLARTFGLSLATALLGSTALAQQDPVRIGSIATLEGAFTVLGEEGMRGWNSPLSRPVTRPAGARSN